MHLKTVKSLADVPFKGVELVKVDNTISEVIIGGKLRIRAGQYSGITVLVDAPGERAKRYKITAELEGFPAAVEYLENSWEANERATHFKGLGATVTQDHLDVLLNDAGAVVETQPEPEPALDEVPF
jgi:hypothetical protein